MKFSFIALHYNQFEEISQQLIPSIQMAMEGFFDYEILIVDDNSDQYEQLLTLASDKVKIQQCPVKQNQGMSRNMSLRVATGDVFTCADGDDYYHPIGLREACQQIATDSESLMWDSKIMKKHSRSNQNYVQSVGFASSIYATFGNMQYFYRTDHIRDNDLYWCEGDYCWHSEDHYFNCMALGHTPEGKLVALETEYPVAIHPLYTGSNSDRGVAPWYLLYVLRMCRDTILRIPESRIKSEIAIWANRRVKQYLGLVQITKMNDLTMVKTIENKIIETGITEVSEDVRDCLHKEIERNRTRIARFDKASRKAVGGKSVSHS